MSYILDALKKAEQERKQGEIPNLQSIHGRRPGQPNLKKRGAIWFWLAGGALLVLIALGAWWGVTKNRVHNLALQEQIAALERQKDDLQRQPAPDEPPSSTTTILSPVPVTESVEAVTAANATVPEDNIPRPAPAPSILPDASMPSPETEPVAPVLVASPKTPVPVAEKITQQSEGVSSFPPPDLVVVPQQRGKAAKEAKTEEAQLASLPLLQDLPNETQKRLPSLKISGHVYAREPGKRMVLINNRICREGDLVEKDLYLENIIWEGVVLRYQDIRFRMIVL